MLALIDRNFQGFGKELFTDAGKYVIHFGQAPEEAAEQVCTLFCGLQFPELRSATLISCTTESRSEQ